MYILKILTFQHILFLIFSEKYTKASRCRGPQDLLVTYYDCEENEQKTLYKYAINQVTQCETEPQAIETTDEIATLYSKARATTVTGYKLTATFSEKKVHCSQVSNGNKNRLDHESFYICELERTQILQSLALAVLKVPYAGSLLSGNRSNFLDYEGNILWFHTCTKKVSPLYVFEDKRCYKRIPIFYKNKVLFVDTLSRRTYFWDTAVPCGSENSHNVVQLNPDEDKYYLLTPYPTLMQPLKKFSPESIRAIARNPNIDLQSIGIYSKSDIQHHI